MHIFFYHVAVPRLTITTFPPLPYICTVTLLKNWVMYGMYKKYFSVRFTFEADARKKVAKIIPVHFPVSLCQRCESDHGGLEFATDVALVHTSRVNV